jgi:DNA modification methylase
MSQEVITPFEAKIERVPIDALKPYAGNARTHSKRQIKQIANSIKRFGFTNPVLVSDDLTILGGHGRVEGAKLNGITEVPIVKLSHLSEEERRAYVLTDNRLAEKAGWNRELLALELQALVDVDFDVSVIGFEVPEIDHVIDSAREANPNYRPLPEDDAPARLETAVTAPGNVWILGRHKLTCADAREKGTYSALLGPERADLIFTDPPYNLPVNGFAGGRGKAERREFMMAHGEMSSPKFETFLKASLSPAAEACRDGAIAFVCMDWRHMCELQRAGSEVFSELKNVCVWTKNNGGMGALYRSQHEFVLVFKVGTGAHRNNIELGRHGRNRTNVWAYAGVNTFKADRQSELEMHPTVKPVALIEDAIKDVTRRGDIVLDPFGGSGSTLIAAERCGRTARLIEIDPSYCDVIIERYQIYSGAAVILEGSDKTFEDVASDRQGQRGSSGSEAP